MTESHPARWFYGGIISRIPWDGDETSVDLWGGETVTVRRGDTLLVYLTGQLVSVVVDVERKPAASTWTAGMQMTIAGKPVGVESTWGTEPDPEWMGDPTGSITGHLTPATSYSEIEAAVLRASGIHVEGGRDCWCAPDVLAICPDCDGSVDGCWACTQDTTCSAGLVRVPPDHPGDCIVSHRHFTGDP